MAKQFDVIEPPHRAFIEAQHLFFVGTAAETGRVNVSPKGMDSLRVMGPNRIAWRNLTGSGNETAGHLARLNRMTLMWCGFETRPLVLRCYGTAATIHPGMAEWDELDPLFDPFIGARQIFDMRVELVQTSCGFAVPRMDFRAERDTLTKWTEDRGAEGVKAYWDQKNTRTIDGFATGTGSQ